MTLNILHISHFIFLFTLHPNISLPFLPITPHIYLLQILLQLLRTHEDQAVLMLHMCMGSGRHLGPAHCLVFDWWVSLWDPPKAGIYWTLLIISWTFHSVHHVFLLILTFRKAQAPPSSWSTGDKNIAHFSLWTCFPSRKTMSTCTAFPHPSRVHQSVLSMSSSPETPYRLCHCSFSLLQTALLFLDEAILIVNEGLCSLFLKWMWYQAISWTIFIYMFTKEGRLCFLFSLWLFSCWMRVILRGMSLDVALWYLFHEVISVNLVYIFL